MTCFKSNIIQNKQGFSLYHKKQQNIKKELLTAAQTWNQSYNESFWRLRTHSDQTKFVFEFGFLQQKKNKNSSERILFFFSALDKQSVGFKTKLLSRTLGCSEL